MPDRDTYRKGTELRRQVLGDAYVDANLAESDDFMLASAGVLTPSPRGAT